jgi:hypothetical protein
MSKAKKTKAPHRRSELDRIVTRLRTMLRRDTTSVIEKGKLLLRSRELLADEHGEWMSWLEKNKKHFDMSYRTAINYCHAAEYVARKSKFATVANFANVAPGVLYRLAAGQFDEGVEAAILAEARERRVDEDAMWAICDRLAPPDDDDADDADDQDNGDDDDDAEEAPDAESQAILDGPPPAMPPPAPSPPPPDFALRDFDQAVSALKQLMTKPSATNGRHRFAFLRDHGVKAIPVAMQPDSIENARRHGYLHRVYATRSRTVVINAALGMQSMTDADKPKSDDDDEVIRCKPVLVQCACGKWYFQVHFLEGGFVYGGEIFDSKNRPRLRLSIVSMSSVLSIRWEK